MANSFLIASAWHIEFAWDVGSRQPPWIRDGHGRQLSQDWGRNSDIGIRLTDYSRSVDRGVAEWLAVSPPFPMYFQLVVILAANAGSICEVVVAINGNVNANVDLTGPSNAVKTCSIHAVAGCGGVDVANSQSCVYNGIDIFVRSSTMPEIRCGLRVRAFPLMSRCNQK